MSDGTGVSARDAAPDIASDEPITGKFPLPAPPIDWSLLPSPCYVIDEGLLIRNLKLLRDVADAAECKILLAQKAFSMYSFYPLISEYLDGAASSSLFEARLAREEMRKEVHIYAPAYRDDEFDEIRRICDHVVFNSAAQWRRFASRIRGEKSAGENKKININKRSRGLVPLRGTGRSPSGENSAGKTAEARPPSCGIRVNPEYSEIETEIYNPCAPRSRLGTTAAEFEADMKEITRISAGENDFDSPAGLEGLHFHTMCEQGTDTLERTLAVFEKKFGKYLRSVKWVNFGGGHHITRADYDITLLVRLIRRFREKYGVDVYLEPGEAIALNAGFLAATVLDITRNGMDIALLDASAACHMPDVLEMPYTPHILGSAAPGAIQSGNHPHIYRLGSSTCLSGDVIGDYAFRRRLVPGDRLVFCDMAIYTMVKNNTFNGVNLPSIVIHTRKGECRVIKTFGYEDFKSRLS
ncbi:MAG: carboxynorspermidine decarboxylase [Synergistaceae bacterium]|jgi:carboxynorspermidine decarboxylase|nr:carboxynorspermidine decarboxylase [Synergistaceae bacterium]